MTKEEILQKLRTDMELRGRKESTILHYSMYVKRFQDLYDKPADQMGEAEISGFLHHMLTEERLHSNTANNANSAIRFLYGVTLDKLLNYKKLPRIKANRSLPDLPDKTELQQIFDAAPNLKYRAVFMTIYGSGLRISEAANLKISDIDSKSMRILIRGGKGGRDRYALLPEKTLLILREYYKQYRPQEWLFLTRVKTKMTVRSIQTAFNSTVTKSGINKPITVHTLRHCFATHLLNEGASVFEIKKLMGHVRIDTTTWYLQLSDSDAMKIASPLDTMRNTGHA